jgi:hypothetical protein
MLADKRSDQLRSLCQPPAQKLPGKPVVERFTRREREPDRQAAAHAGHRVACSAASISSPLIHEC